MNNITLAAFLVAVLSATQGLSFLLRNRSNRQYQAFAGLCSAIVFTNLAVALDTYGIIPDRVLGMMRMLGGLACAATATVFFSRLLRYRTWAFRVRPGSIVTAGVLGVLTLATYQSDPPLETPELLAVGEWLRVIALERRDPGPLPAELTWGRVANHLTIWASGIYIFGTFALLIQGIARMRRATRSPSERARLTVLTWLGGVTILACVAQSLVWYLKPEMLGFPLGGLAQLVFVYFLSQVLLQYRLLDLHEMLAKLIIFVVLSVVVALCYALVFLGFSKEGAPGSQLVTLLLASGIVLTLYDPLKRWVERLTHRLFFRRRFLLRAELDVLERELPTVAALDVVLDRILQALKGASRLSRAAIYLWNESYKVYRLERRFGPDDWTPPEGVAQSGPFVEGLRRPGGAWVIEDLERDAPTEPRGEGVEATDRPASVILRQMHTMNVELVVPFHAGDVVLGFIALGGDVAEGYTHDEVILLLELAEHASRSIMLTESVARLAERERLAALGAMAAGLAHEIRNPLGAIKGAAQYLTGAAADPESREFLDIIVAESDRLNRVVTEFLDYARPLKLQRREVDLPLVLRQVARMFEVDGVSAGVQIQVQVEPDLPPLTADEEKLRQVLLNLGRNALQSMAHGGALTLSARRGSLGARRSQPCITVEVTDTGCGIAPEHLQKIFIPFFTTRQEGNGLGLAISQRLIEAHEGTLRVESTPGQGSRFTVQLPLAQGVG